MDNHVIIMEQVYDALVTNVWGALTDKAKMAAWYFEIPDFEFEKGAVFNFYEPGGKNEYLHQCTILEIIPLQKFQHTWTYPEKVQGTTTLTWELLEEGEKTRVRLSHSGIENFSVGGEAFARHNFEIGWKQILSESLRNYLKKI